MFNKSEAHDATVVYEIEQNRTRQSYKLDLPSHSVHQIPFTVILYELLWRCQDGTEILDRNCYPCRVRCSGTDIQI
jgi:hypothetical protein